ILVEKNKDVSDSSEKVFNHIKFNENKKSNKNIYIFIDPYVDRDIYFLNNIIKKELNNVYEFNCNHAGHEVFFHLRKTNQLKNIIKLITNEKEPIVYEIDSCYSYIGRAKEYLKTKDYSAALFFSER